MFQFNAGTAFMQAGQLEQAIPHFERAISADSDYALAAFNLAMCYDHLDRLNDALRWYKRSAKLDPTDPDPVYNIAEIQLRKKSFRRAIRECQKALALCDTKFREIQFSTSLPPGESLTKEQMLAEVVYKKATTHSLMALIHASQRKPKRALVAIQQAVELYPYHPDWFLFMSEVHEHLGNYVEARKAYTAAQQLRQNAVAD
jgi:tetratricopeptide (TPR) repeat protein